MALSKEAQERLRKLKANQGRIVEEPTEEKSVSTVSTASNGNLSADTIKRLEALKASMQSQKSTNSTDLAPVKQSGLTSFVSSDPDFEKKSQAGLNAYNQYMTAQTAPENKKNFFQRFMNAYLSLGTATNDNPAVMAMNQQAAVYRNDEYYRKNYPQLNPNWSEDQKKLFGYYYNVSPQAAAQYAEEVNNQINKEAAKAEETLIKQTAGNNILKSTGEILLKGATGLGDFLDNVAEFSGTGDITQKGDLSFFEESQAAMEGVSQKLNELGTIPENVPIVGGKGLGDLYGLGISAAKSLAYGVMGNEALTMLQFFGEAAASGVDEKLEQGATASQAMLYGLASGTAEAVAEKIGIDNLFKNTGGKTFRSVLSGILKQGFAEGLEEAITSVINTFSDEVIMGNQSQYKKAVAEYSKTMSESKAKWKAFWDIINGIAFDALGGFITGGGNAMVMTAGNAAKNVATGKGAFSGLTTNEQKVVDKVYEELVAEEAKNSKDGKVSAARKNELFEEAIKAMDEGSISVETIEEVLGGDTYLAYQQAVKDNADNQNQLKEQLEKDVAALAKVSRLNKSYLERDRRSQAFQADVKPVRGEIYGSDVELAPVRKDLALEQEEALEQKQKELDEKIIQERQKLGEEFDQEAERLTKLTQSQDVFRRKMAKDLYTELQNLKKGVKASKELSELLDHKFEWSDLRTALLNAKDQALTVNAKSQAEAAVRELIDRKYQEAVKRLEQMPDLWDQQEQDLVQRLTREAGIQERTKMDTAETKTQDEPRVVLSQRLETTLQNLKTELKANRENRQTIEKAYDQKIKMLEEKYAGLKNKATKEAAKTLKQINRQKRLRDESLAIFDRGIKRLEKRVDKTQEAAKWEHTSQDALEKKLFEVDDKLEADKKALEAEIEERRGQLQTIAGDKKGYIRNTARELYDELRSLTKGERASPMLGVLLDKFSNRNEVKQALLRVAEKPELPHRTKLNSVETYARNLIKESFDEAIEEIGTLDNTYQERLKNLEEQAQADREALKIAAQRRRVQERLEIWAEKLVGDTSKWKDKKLGLQYQVNTLRRNLRDVVRDENGNQDIARADAIWQELQGMYNHNEAELKRESARIKEEYAKLKLTKEENVYVQMLGEFRHNPDTTLSLDTVEGYLEEHKDKIDTEKVDKAIEMARKTYDDLLVRVNAALREMGMKEIPYRKGYFPHFTEEAKGKFRTFLEKGLNFKYKSDDIPTDIAGLTEGFTPNRSWQSFNKERTSDITEYNFEKGLDTYVHGALDWIYHIEDIQKRRAVENHIRYVHSDEGAQAKIDAVKKNNMLDADQVQEEIEKILGEKKNPLNNLVNDLRTGTNILAGKKTTMDRNMEQRFNRKAYSIMSGISNRINANMVAGSISSALTNFIPITQSWGEVSPVNSLAAMKETIKAAAVDDGVVNKSDFLTNRLRQEENLYKTGWDKVNDKVGWFMEVVDSFTSQTVWRSKYMENIQNGMTEAQAIKNADEFAEGLMAGRSRGNMPTLFEEKNPITKILTAFQLEVNNQYGYMLKDMPINMRKETKAKLVAGYVKMFVGAYAYNAAYSLLTGRTAAFDPLRILEDLFKDLFPGEDEEKKKPSEIMGGFLEDVGQEMPFISSWLGGGRIQISSALPYGDADGPIEGITNMVKDIEDGKFATWEWLNPVAYLIAPVGGGQLRKSAMGLSMFLGDKPVSGSYTASGNLRFPVDPTFGNVAQAALFGQWASKNARKYIEEGRSPIAQSQIQDFIDSGLTYEGWMQQKDTLKKVDAAFDSNEQIMEFNETRDLLEELAADDMAGDKEILQEKFIQSAARELSKIKAEMREIAITPMRQEYKDSYMQNLQQKANEIAENAILDSEGLKINGEYAQAGDKVWKRDKDGDWKQITGEQLEKYRVTIGANASVYATDGKNHYIENDEGWRKLTDKQVEKQNAVTKRLQIDAKEYWGEKHEEYDFAYENPELYVVAKTVGGYDSYKVWKAAINQFSGENKKSRIWEYIDMLDLDDGQKYTLFKSIYPKDDTYNQAIIDYIESRKDLTATEKRKMLAKLELS